MIFSAVNAPCERKNPTMNTSSAEDVTTESASAPIQPNTSATDRSHIPDAASQIKQTPSTMAPMASPAATTEQQYDAGVTHPATGETLRSAEIPRERSWIMIPQAHSGTVMQAHDMEPASIQLLQKAEISASPPATPISSSAASSPFS